MELEGKTVLVLGGFGLVGFARIGAANWIAIPPITLPAFGDPRAWGAIMGVIHARDTLMAGFTSVRICSCM